MHEFFGFPKDVWSKLVLLNEEETELDWNLQKRDGAFKLSVFWKPKTTTAVRENGSQASVSASQAKQQRTSAASPWIRRERQKPATSSTQVQHHKTQDLRKKKEKKHKSPSVLRRDQARLEKWRNRWHPAEQSPPASQTREEKREEPEQKQTEPKTSGGHQRVASVISNAGKSREADDHHQKELILASIQRLQELKHNTSVSAEIAAPAAAAAASDAGPIHSLDSVLRVSCFHCNKPGYEVAGGLKLCTRCRGASYCSRDCQTKDWKVHKPICSPAKTNIIEKITSSLQQELQVLTQGES